MKLRCILKEVNSNSKLRRFCYNAYHEVPGKAALVLRSSTEWDLFHNSTRFKLFCCTITKPHQESTKVFWTLWSNTAQKFQVSGLLQLCTNVMLTKRVFYIGRLLAVLHNTFTSIGRGESSSPSECSDDHLSMCCKSIYAQLYMYICWCGHGTYTLK